MREIAFKAKEIGTGDWIYGYLVKIHEDDYRIVTEDDLNYAYTGGYDYDGTMTKIDKNTICQYTGLTDKNGNKIWENDVVKRYNANGDEWRISKIVWADHSLNMGWCIEDVKSLTEYSNRLFKIGFDVNDTEKCEVIGNIFDNPELLEGGADNV